MARGAVRGMVTAWLGLIALQAVSTAGGSGRVASAFADVNGLLQRAIDPRVPAIPDRGATAAASSTSSPTPTRPGQVGNFTSADAYSRNNPAPSVSSRLPIARQPF